MAIRFTTVEPGSMPQPDAIAATSQTRPSLDLAELRAKLDGGGGRRYWRSLEEVAGTPEFERFLHAEFPSEAPTWGADINRRDFLRLMGASLALAGLSACTRQPTERILPYVKAPEEIVPGRPLFFATTMPAAGGGIGLLVESHMGRPTKIEGNPDHPASLGGTDAISQASVLDLYDPSRSQTITNAGEIRPWSAFLDELGKALELQAANQGAGIRLLTGAVSSPTLAAQIAALLDRYPNARWHRYEPVCRDGERAGSTIAWGRALDTVCHFDRADVVVSLDADFFTSGGGAVRYIRDVMRRRRPGNSDHGAARDPGQRHQAMNRLYVVESGVSLTGSVADHRLALEAHRVEDFALELAAAVGVEVTAPKDGGHHRKWIDALAADLRRTRGRCLIVAGAHQSAVVHAVAHAINEALGNRGTTVDYIEPVEAAAIGHLRSLTALVSDMRAGRVDLLVVLGGNPVYDAPADLDFAGAIQKVGLRVRLGLYEDETSRLCHWHVPEAHYLEAWSDARAYDGTVGIVQPLIAPLYEGRTGHEMLAVLLGDGPRPPYDIVRDYWRKTWQGQAGGQRGDVEFEHRWRRALHDGIVADTASPPVSVRLRANWSRKVQALRRAGGAYDTTTLEVVFRPDSNVFDGRFTNNAWLQELPRPLTKLTWDNAALIAPATAERLGLATEDRVELSYRGRRLEAPVWVMPGHPVESVTLHLGYGRTRAGKVADGVGFNAYTLRTSDAPWFDRGLTLRKLDGRHALVCTQHHHSMEGRDIVRSTTVRELAGHGASGHHDEHGSEGHGAEAPATMFPPHPYAGHAWGMAIDLSACIGCNACAVACQAENNIAVVGKDQVSRGREMNWIRIDRYYSGGLDEPTIHHQPVPCMQCENAPCEIVCPVGATVHSSEGLNDMVYNRCVGTRYCSNNCPYKVRRFNFYLYSDWNTLTLKMQRNPDVTVRSRGVMEKCTYCVQRINQARITAKREGRAIRDGEIVTACQAACPAEAIVFGDVNDPHSRVSQHKADTRNYALLEELGTRPRTTYLAEVRNPNPALEKAENHG